jgi:hypothetical protein
MVSAVTRISLPPTALTWRESEAEGICQRQAVTGTGLVLG